MSNCVCFWKYQISCNDLAPPQNFIHFPSHQLGLSVAQSLEVSGCLFLSLSHSHRVQPLASYGVWYLNIFLPTLLIPLFLATRSLGVCFVRAILPHWKYLEHKLLATLLNRSAHVGATSCTLALDWLEALAPHADLIASKQWSFSHWLLNSLDIFQQSKFTVPNFQINVNFSLFFCPLL